MLAKFFRWWYIITAKAQKCTLQEHSICKIPLNTSTLEETPMERYLENYPPVLSVDDVAQILGITPKTVRNLIKNGEIAGIKVGRLIRVPKDRLGEYLERGKSA